MWIVLLDRSGSMAEPFSAAPDARSRRERITDAETKLVAAEEIAALGRAVPVVIFAFNSEVEEIFSGTAEEREKIAATLAAVVAENGTNIARALDAAADYNRQHSSNYVIRIVLISDGKSDVGEAVQAAQRCLDFSIGIHFILNVLNDRCIFDTRTNGFKWPELFSLASITSAI
jgi:hypothetical protein